MSATQEKWPIILLIITSCLEIMTSWRIFQYPLGLCNIKIYSFVDISTFFTIMKVIYSGIWRLRPFRKLTINVAPKFCVTKSFDDAVVMGFETNFPNEKHCPLKWCSLRLTFLRSTHSFHKSLFKEGNKKMLLYGEKHVKSQQKRH